MALPTPAELEQLLLARLNLSPEDQKEFLAPTYRLGDLFKFSAMEQAVGRIYDALKGGEYIGIYSDYDCDGIPGAVVLLDFFKKIGAQDHVHVYIPDRHDEGYGISTQGIDVLEAKGVSLIITVDVGITAIAQVADAQSRGIDVIVTDHHEPLDTLPTAYAIVHPRVGTYDNQDPCGAGVAFYLVCAFLERHRTEFDIPDGWEKWLLDMVALATVADMVEGYRSPRGPRIGCSQ